MFISEPVAGRWFTAERSIRSQARTNGLRWHSVPITPTEPYTRINARQVPHRIRRQAYRYFYNLKGS